MADTNRTPDQSLRRSAQGRTIADRTARATNDEWSSVVLEEELPGLPEREFDLVLERIARLQNELTDLKRYESLYFEKVKECAVLRQKLRQLAAGNQLVDLCLPVGGVLVGLTAALCDQGHWILGLVVFLTGIVLIGGRLRLRYHQRTD